MLIDKMLNENSVFGIVGLGLMGAAFAIALRETCGIEKEKLVACDLNSETLNTAINEGLIGQGWDAGNAGEMLSSCDVVFLCLNPSHVIRFLEKHEASFKYGCLITDIAGIKNSIAMAANKLRPDIDFIPGHPMAGAHIQNRALNKAGESYFANSRLCDFRGKNYILTPLSRNKRDNLEFLKNLIRRIGFGCITEASPEEHDRKIAWTSQLCHVIAAALIDSEADTAITRFGGGSFEDLTRIAMLNAPMWTELFIDNRDALIDCIEKFEASLDEIKTLIGSAQASELEKRLEIVRERRTAM